MYPLKDSVYQIEFTQEEYDVLTTHLSSPTIRAYIRSTFAQLRDSALSAQEPPYSAIPNAGERLAFISGAEELFTQILRIGTDS